MKTLKHITVLCIVCTLIITVSHCKSDPFKDVGDELSQNPLTRSGEQEWDYPVKPGMAEWNSLQTENERIAAEQVPESVLATLSPDEAVRLCITLPAAGNFIAWSPPQRGFNVMLERYNILRHIVEREDAGGSLIAAYKDASLSGFKTLPYSNEFWSLKLFYLELLLSQKEILQKMTPAQKLELITEARTKYFEKLGNEDFASLPELLFSLRIMATILDLEGYPELMVSPDRETITEFLNTGWFLDKPIPIEEIGGMIDNYINSKNQIQ